MIGKKVLHSPVLGGCLLLGMLILNLWWARPDYNWDMLPYLALSYQYANASPTEAHARAYDIARQTVPARDFQQLTEGNPYRSTMTDDPSAFNQQLPGYRVKLVYPWLISRVDALGLNPVRASVLISQVAYLIIGLVIVLWVSSWTNAIAAAATSWAIMSQTFAIDLAQLSTPDAISTLVVLSALWLMFERQLLIPALVLLAASVAIRPDNVLWLIAAAAYCVVRYPARRMVAIASSAAGILLVLALSAWADLPGWTTLFHHAFVERVAYQQDFQPVLSPFGYIRTYLRESHPAFLPLFLPIFSALGVSLLWYRLRRYGRQDSLVGLLATLALFGAMHWVLYPDDDRFFIAAYLAIMVVLVRTLLFTPASEGVRTAEVPG